MPPQKRRGTPQPRQVMTGESKFGSEKGAGSALPAEAELEDEEEGEAAAMETA